MKDIKFRGKRIDNGEWVYGSLTICNAFDLKDGIHKPEPLLAFIRKQNIEWLSNPDDKRWTFPSYKVIPETVGQYTGLKDNKRTEEYPEGQEIYGSLPINSKMSKGGDIVKVHLYPGAKHHSSPFNAEVMWAKHCWSWAFFRKSSEQYYCPAAGLPNCVVEVIGNAAEKPELLEK